MTFGPVTAEPDFSVRFWSSQGDVLTKKKKVKRRTTGEYEFKLRKMKLV